MSTAARLIGAFFVVVALCGSSSADDIEAARAHFVEGSKAFDLGLYDKAVKEYMAAYDAKPDPALLYNIAQAHKLAGHAADALRFYRVFLLRVPDAANAVEVRAKIAELQRAIEQQQKAQAMPPDHVKALGSVASAPRATAATASPARVTAPASVAAAQPPTVTSAPAADASDRRRGRLETTVGIATAAVGVAALASGIGLAVVAKQDSDQLTALDRQNGVFDASKDSNGRAFGVAGPALIGVGAALVVVGGVVVIVGARQSRRARASASDGGTRVSSRPAPLAF